MDCGIWLEFLQGELKSIVNRPMIDLLERANTSREIGFYSDASASKKAGYGFGAILGKRWVKGSRNLDFLNAADPSIKYLELFALCVGILTWNQTKN